MVMLVITAWGLTLSFILPLCPLVDCLSCTIKLSNSLQQAINSRWDQEERGEQKMKREDPINKHRSSSSHKKTKGTWY